MTRPESFFPMLPAASTRRSAVVFLHGLFGGMGNFDRTARAVQPYAPVLVPELPLFTDHSVQPSLSGLLEWLDHTLEGLDAGPFVLAGNSLGGQLACLYAALKPGNVRALVLTGAAGMGEHGLGTSRPRRFDPAFIRERARLTFHAMEPDDALIDHIMEVVSQPSSLKRLLALSRDSMRTRLDHLLPSITCPVQLIWGQNDRITPPGTCEAFARALPDARMHFIEACGHAPMMEQPDQFNRLLLDFLFHPTEQPLLSQTS